MKIFSDSSLVVNQVNYTYIVREEKMAVYLEKTKEQLSLFSAASIEVIPRSKNLNVDASMRDAELLDTVFVEYLAKPSIHPQPRIIVIGV